MIGLFHDMFQNNVLTFNPGFREDAGQPALFTDVRHIRNRLLEPA